MARGPDVALARLAPSLAAAAAPSPDRARRRAALVGDAAAMARLDLRRRP
ncbi:MAG: hypothetical protein R2939_21650 [Kofleriaceae bacterium]